MIHTSRDDFLNKQFKSFNTNLPKNYLIRQRTKKKYNKFEENAFFTEH